MKSTIRKSIHKAGLLKRQKQPFHDPKRKRVDKLSVIGRNTKRSMSVTQITSSLFLGSAESAMDQTLVSRKHITLIINATVTHTNPAYRGVECIRIAVPDLPHARLGDHFERVADRIHNNRAGSTLVHCAAGMSRSPALVMAYLMRYRGVTLRQAHHWVRDRRPHICLNAGFWRQLLQYEKQLYGKNSVRVATSPRLQEAKNLQGGARAQLWR